MHQAGRVTIAVPTRNRSQFVIGAVLSALAQTYRDVEVVVSDNASSDDTVAKLEQIKDPRLVLVRQKENIGLVGNFNSCLENASGEFFLLLSDDDLLHPNAIEYLSTPFRTPFAQRQSNSFGLSWSPAEVIDTSGAVMWRSEAGPEVESTVSFLAEYFNGNRGPRLCTIMIRTADARQVGGYDLGRDGLLCDIGNFARVALLHENVACIGQVMAQSRLHPSSSTSSGDGREWQRLGEKVCKDLSEILSTSGDLGGAMKLRSTHRNFVSNQLVSIGLNRENWFPYMLRECVRAPQYLLTPFVLKRFLRDGWKLLGRYGRQNI